MQLYGEGGSDIIRGGWGNDTILSGGSGNDLISGRGGLDTATGGSGADVYEELLAHLVAGESFTGGSGFDRVTIRGTSGSNAFNSGNGFCTSICSDKSLPYPKLHFTPGIFDLQHQGADSNRRVNSTLAHQLALLAPVGQHAQDAGKRLLAAGGHVDDRALARVDAGAVLDHIAANSDLYRVLLSSGGVALEPVKAYAYREAINALEQVPDLPIPPPILAQHMVATIFSLVQWWLENEMPYSPQEMAIHDEKWHTENFMWGNSRVRQRDFWTEEIVNSRLEQLMISAFTDVDETARRYGVWWTLTLRFTGCGR